MASRTHLSFVFDEADLGDIAALRRRFDPEMAAGVPPHVSLLYPEEHHDDLDLVMERAHAAAKGFGRFTLRCGQATTGGDDGTGGVFVDVDDLGGTWTALRNELVAPPFEAFDDVRPHLTIVHPRTSDQGPRAWAELQGPLFDRSFGVVLAPSEFHLTVTDTEHGMRLDETFELTGTGRAIVATVLLVDDDDRVLLGRRRDDRTWYPGGWDVIGGHVEPGETVAAGARRELAEEAGVAIDSADLRLLDTIVGDDFELVAFATRRWTGEPTNLAPDEHGQIAWHPIDDVAGLDLVHPAIGPLCRAAIEITS